MAKYFQLTHRGNQRLKDLFADARVDRIEYHEAGPITPLPVLGVATASIGEKSLGSFRLQKMTPDSLVSDTDSREAYAMCAMTTGDLCILHWVTGAESNGFWAAMKCSEGGTPNAICAFASTDFPNPMSMTISGVSTAGVPGGGDFVWASQLNGSHSLTNIFQSSDCSRTVELGGQGSGTYIKVEMMSNTTMRLSLIRNSGPNVDSAIINNGTPVPLVDGRIDGSATFAGFTAVSQPPVTINISSATFTINP